MPRQSQPPLSLDDLPTGVGLGKVAAQQPIQEQFERARRAVVFRPEDEEVLDSGSSTTLDLHMVTGDGTTVTHDNASTVVFKFLLGTGTILTPQPIRFVNGTAQVTIRKDAPGMLRVGIDSLTPSGVVEDAIDTTTFKDTID